VREQWESCSRGEEGRKKVRADAHGAVLLPSAMEQGGEMAWRKKWSWLVAARGGRCKFSNLQVEALLLIEES
jgi:hypothetical protein